jgi:hypothetical protein
MTISGTAARAAKLTQDLNVSSSILSSVARYSGPPVQPAVTRPLLAATVVTTAGLARSGPPRPLSQQASSFVRRRPEIDGPVSRILPGPATLGRGGFTPPSNARAFAYRGGVAEDPASRDVTPRPRSWPLHARSSALISFSVENGFAASAKVTAVEEAGPLPCRARGAQGQTGLELRSGRPMTDRHQLPSPHAEADRQQLPDARRLLRVD